MSVLKIRSKLSLLTDVEKKWYFSYDEMYYKLLLIDLVPFNNILSLNMSLTLFIHNMSMTLLLRTLAQ